MFAAAVSIIVVSFSSLARIDSSARLRSVISWAMATAPTMSPSRFLIADQRDKHIDQGAVFPATDGIGLHSLAVLQLSKGGS